MNIGLIGKLRSGKDTVGEHLMAYYGYQRFAFGDGIKLIGRNLWPEAFDPSAPKPRALMQRLGQSMREIDPNVWVDKTLRVIDFAQRFRGMYPQLGPFKAVITDVRQPNEVLKLRKLGYTLIRVNCPDDIRLERARANGDNFNLADLTHETEMHVDTFKVDYEIWNGGTLENTIAQIDDIMGGRGGVQGV
jgi:dephospho-CoA kinase